MPTEEQTNLEEEQVQSSQEATDDALTLEQLQSKKPEEILELYNNAVEMRKSATHKYMESAEDRAERKRLEAEREYLLNDRQQKDAEVKRLSDLLVQYNQTLQQTRQQQPSSPRQQYDETDPGQAYAQLYQKNQELENKISEYDKKWSAEKESLVSEIRKTQSAIDYREFLKEEIFPKYEFVTQKGLDEWFTEHPHAQFTGDERRDRKLVHLAASEIQKREDDIIEARVQARLAEKAKKADTAAVTAEGAPLVALPEGKKMIDMDRGEQEEIIRRDLERLQGK